MKKTSSRENHVAAPSSAYYFSINHNLGKFQTHIMDANWIALENHFTFRMRLDKYEEQKINVYKRIICHICYVTHEN